MNDHVNQTFGQMNKVALEWLKDRDPVEIARRAGVSYDEKKQVFTFSSMGILLTLTWPDYTVSPQIGGWHYLLILHYLHIADGTPLADWEMSFSQMKAGMMRGGGIDRKFEQAIQAVKHLDESKLDAICTGIGAEKTQSNADVTYQIPFLPRFPVTLKVWLPDEEFPASGRLLVDESADHYFTTEDAVTVAELLIEKIAIPKEHRSFVNQ